jgi:triosephosphate isomerase
MSATGSRAVSLAKKCDKVARETKANIAVAVQASDIYRVSKEVSIPVLSQHIDGIEFGSNTGSILAEAVKQNGAFGTLINHSEKRIPMEKIKGAVKRAKENGLVVVCCAKDDNEGKKISALKPDFVAVEPPELIGGDISVSTSKPGLIKDSVKKIGNNVIVGAGVKTTEDVKKAVELGSVGVLVASGITKAENPEKALKDLVKGLK